MSAVSGRQYMISRVVLLKYSYLATSKPLKTGYVVVGMGYDIAY